MIAVIEPPDLPYFDLLLQRLAAGDPRFCEAFGRHVHWGHWPDPRRSDRSSDGFAEAAERLCRLVVDAACVADGQRILDAGCGFGGTVASLNARFNGLDLIGLNIDPRQLERAAARVHPTPGNRIRWVAADACALPLPDHTLDAVLAVECIFHFPSREEFFRECARVLRPGGRLALSDFVPTPALKILLAGLSGGRDASQPSAMAATYGRIDCSWSAADYRRLAQRHGFRLCLDRDITAGTLPTYPVVEDLFACIGALEAVKATRSIAWLSRLGLLRYRVMGWVCDSGPKH